MTYLYYNGITKLIFSGRILSTEINWLQCKLCSLAFDKERSTIFLEFNMMK